MRRSLLHLKSIWVYFFSLVVFFVKVEVAEAAIFQRGTATSATTANTTLTIAKPSGVEAGDVMIVQIVQGGTGNGSSSAISDVSPAGWTKIAGSDIRNSNWNRCRATLLYKIAIDADVVASDFSFTMNSNASNAEGAIIAFSGVDTSDPFDITPASGYNNINNDNSLNASSITPVTPNSALVMFGALADNWNLSSWTTGLTELYDLPFDATFDIGMGAALQLNVPASATGEKTAQFGIFNNAYNGSILIALKPLPSPIITSFTPTSACSNSGTSVVITGTNLTGATNVSFNGTSATYTVNSATQIIATLPTGSTTGKIGVTTPGGTTSSVGDFTVNQLPANPTTSITQPTCSVATGTITVTSPTGTGMTYSIDGVTYTNATGTFTSVVPGAYTVTAKNSAGCISSGTSVTINAQPASPTLTAGGGGDYCVGSTISLTSSIPVVKWTGPNGFTSASQNPSLSNVTAAMTGTYAVTNMVNLVVNGDFESRYTGFTTEYVLAVQNSTGLNPESTYDVVKLPSSRHGNFCSCGDHTSGSGYQMVINGASTEKTVWATSSPLTVVPNTTYQFSYWVQTVVNGNDPNPSKLQLFVNGTAILPIYTANSTTGVWTQFIYNWTSGTGASTVTLALKNENFVSNGNDFAIDDIVFQPACEATASVNITVNALPAASISYSGSPYCATGTASVTRTGQTGGTYSSTAGLSINGTTGAINLAASTPGTYTVTYSFSGGTCSNTTTTSVTINALPSVNITGNASICAGSATTLTPSTGGTWSSSNTSVATVTNGGIVTGVGGGTVTFTFTQTSTGCSNTTSAITVLPVFTAGTIANTGQTICYGGTPTIPIGSTTSASGGDNMITYQWQYSTDNTFATGVTTVANNSATYTPTQSLTQTTYYRRQAKDGFCNTTSYTSSANTWVVTVNGLPSAPSAANKSKNYTGVANTTSISATVNAGETIDWYDSSSGGTLLISGSATYTPTAVSAATYTYYAEARNSSTGCVSSSRTPVTLTIIKAPLTVTADNHTKVYDGAAYSSFTVSYSGFVNGETSTILGGTLSFTGTAPTAKNVGSAYVITPGGLTSSNYEINFVSGTLTITARPISITADAKSKVYGSADPTLTYQITSGSVVSGDLPSGALSRVSGESVGNYAISKNTLTYGSNYTETYVFADLTITQALLTVTANNKTKVYDGSVYSGFTVSYSGFVNGETSTILGGTLSFSGTAPTAKNVGSGYVITPGGLTSANYKINFVSGVLNITRATLVPNITAYDKCFDGNSSATLSSKTLSGIIAPDVVTLETGSVNFSSAAVGSAKTVTASGLYLSGSDAGNYSLSATIATTSANINALPVPTITGDTSPCDQTSGVVYSTEAGMSGYNWTISSGGTITSGAGTNSITVTWISAGVHTITVDYTNTNGCDGGNAANVTVHPKPLIGSFN